MFQNKLKLLTYFDLSIVFLRQMLLLDFKKVEWMFESNLLKVYKKYWNAQVNVPIGLNKNWSTEFGGVWMP